MSCSKGLCLTIYHVLTHTFLLLSLQGWSMFVSSAQSRLEHPLAFGWYHYCLQYTKGFLRLHEVLIWEVCCCNFWRFILNSGSISCVITFLILGHHWSINSHLSSEFQMVFPKSYHLHPKYLNIYAESLSDIQLSPYISRRTFCNSILLRTPTLFWAVVFCRHHYIESSQTNLWGSVIISNNKYISNFISNNKTDTLRGSITPRFSQLVVCKGGICSLFYITL